MLIASALLMSSSRVCVCLQLVAGMIAASLSFLFSGLLQMYLSDPLSGCHGRVNHVAVAADLPHIVCRGTGQCDRTQVCLHTSAT